MVECYQIQKVIQARQVLISIKIEINCQIQFKESLQVIKILKIKGLFQSNFYSYRQTKIIEEKQIE